MKPAWFIQKNGPDVENHERIARFARDMGHDVVYDNYVPFGGMEWRRGLQLFYRPTIFVGSINAIQSAQQEFAKPPMWNGHLGVWANWQNLTSVMQFAKWSALML